LTVIELVIAMGLLALLRVSVFGVMRGFIDVWNKSEVRRARVEESSSVAELLANDLVQLDGGPRGDLVAQWVAFDTDGDGATDSFWPRLLMVRHASEAELSRVKSRSSEPTPDQGLLEVAWVVVPAFKGKTEVDRRSEGLVLRGERIVPPQQAQELPGADLSYFDKRFFAQSGMPVPGALDELTSGILWFGLEFATQTTILNDGWKLGDRLANSASSWDAWRKARPDVALHAWNEAGAGMPKAKQRALLPRRVRLELEFERPREALRRTRLSEVLLMEGTTMLVDDPQRLPQTANAFVKLDGEWLRIGSSNGRTVSVQRGMRGTKASNHQIGARVHYGETYVREIPIRLSQEDWDL
jgi:hypothetical protein